MNHKLMAALLISVLSASTWMDISDAAPINQRQHNQKERIQQGVKNGSLTPKETARLQHQQKTLKAKEADYRADGKLTSQERRDLKNDQKRLSKNIYHQKHDKQNP